MGRPASGKPPTTPQVPLHGGLIAPDEGAWQAMSRAQQRQFLEEVLAAHSDPREAMAEGRPHRRAKGRALDELSLHFSSTGRQVYLADEMAVVYPGRETCQPDLLAVLEVEQPEEDERLAWVVADEGRGLDLVLEVLHHGNRDKDLRRNVELYATLGIREYFVYDRLKQEIHGFRLPGPAAVEYGVLRPRLGRYTSQVLGLDLALVEGRLRFFSGYAELIGSGELIGRLSTMMDTMEGRLRGVEALLREADERARAEAERAARLAGALREGIVGLLRARGIGVDEAAEARIRATEDADLLSQWMGRAATAASVAEVLGDK